MKRIVIDVNSIVPFFIDGKISGIGRTTMELVEALGEVKNDLPFKLCLYSQNMKGIGAKNLNSSFDSVHFYIPNREKYNRLLAATPLKECLTQYDLMHIPHNFGHVHQAEKTLITLHDALFMRMEEKAFNHLLMREQVPPLMRKCKGIITCSEASKRDIVETMQIDPAKIDVVYWGLKHHVFYYMPDKEEVAHLISNAMGIHNPFYLSVSCNAERKNTHQLVTAYLNLCKQNPDNDLVLVWGNPPEFVLQMIEKSGYTNRVHFVSNISDSELALLYNGAAAMIFPSSYEGFGLPILEAMACGCPVVSCNNSSLYEVGSDAVLYLNSSDEADIRTVLEGFENKTYNLTEIRSKGLSQAANFTWAQTASHHIAIYNKYLEIS
jgi:glycosyltransferase involved in cell wall biosynthesis